MNRKTHALLLLASAQFVVVLDASIVNVALPSIAEDLHFDEANLSWVINAYVLVFGGFLLLGGRMADVLGRRKIFIAGLLLFGVASLAGGLAQTEGWLIGARAVQGLGGALLSAAALAILTTMFAEGAERNRALGVWGAVAGAGGAAGVLLGGILTDALGWEWVFFVNTPVTIALAWGAWRVLPESRNEGEHGFDVPGAVAITAGLSILVYALVDAEDAGWASAQTIGLILVALAIIGIFVFIELRTRWPIVPFGIFKNRTLTGANVCAIFVAMALMSMFYFITLYMQFVLGFSPLKAGLAYIPLSLTIIGCAGLASVLTTRVGFKPVLFVGFLFAAVGLFWFSFISPNGTYVGDVLFPSMTVGAGLGFCFVSCTIGAVVGIKESESGLASGLINTSQQVGGALGLGILVSIANSRSANVIGPPPVKLCEGFQLAFMVGSGFAIAGAICTLLIVRTSDSNAHRDAAQAGEVAPIVV